MNTLTVITASLVLSATICASYVSGRFASQFPPAESSQAGHVNAGAEYGR